VNLKHLHYFWKAAICGSVVRASEELHITPQTISGQIQLLEQELKTELFVRRGRRLELTEAGKFVLGYAKEIFSLESELEEMIRHHPRGRPAEFRVGVADAMPKSLAYRLLEPATQMEAATRIVCHEWRLDSLLSELALHRLDLVLADTPIPQSVDVHAYNHHLGESPVAFFANRTLAERCEDRFPQCLNSMPMLLPGADSPIRTKLVRWLSRYKLHPKLVGEFDGNSLMAAFGQAGFGAFVAPTLLQEEMQAHYDVVAIGEVQGVCAEYFAISVERRLTHPCVLAITRAARSHIFKTGSPDKDEPIKRRSGA
jgi:LysR family transcriptional activator of nhaA